MGTRLMHKSQLRATGYQKNGHHNMIEDLGNNLILPLPEACKERKYLGGDYVIGSFAVRESLIEANEAFTKISEPSIYTWTAIIATNAKLGTGEVSLNLYNKMQLSGVQSNGYACVAVLKACTIALSLIQGRLIHSHVLKSRLQVHVILGNSLINMYAKCGNFEEANLIFINLPHQNVVTWNAIIAGYVQHGHTLLAFSCFEKMQNEGIKPNVVSWGTIIVACTQCGEDFLALECFQRMQQQGVSSDEIIFSSVLKACANIVNIEHGRLLHCQLLKSGFALCPVLNCSLIDMYAKCGSLEGACKVFQKFPIRDGASWRSIIAGYVQHGEARLGLQYFQDMQQFGFRLESSIIILALKACSIIGSIEQGRLVHCKSIDVGLQSDSILGNTLINMYAKCKRFEEACNVFDKLPNKDVVSWNAMIAGYAQHGECSLALECFLEMQKAMVSPNVVSWSALIAGYAEHGEGFLALECFEKMQHEGVRPNHVTFLSICKACANLRVIEQGRIVHDKIIDFGFQSDVVMGNTIVDMYIKCGSLEEAYEVFNKLAKKDAASWAALIVGYAQNGEDLLALECFDQMQQQGISSTNIIFVGVLKACASIGAIDQGRVVHDKITKSGYPLDSALGNTLVDMYFKCGSLKDACDIFENLPNRNAVSWNIMIAGYAQHGKASLALKYFEKMQKYCIMPNEVSFTIIIILCSHMGLVDEGRHHFKSMMEHYGIIPSTFHYACMVDLLSHAGCVRETEALLHSTTQPNVIGWTSLLDACRISGDVHLGKSCFDQIVYFVPQCAAIYVLMSNMYADAQMEEDAFRILQLASSAGSWKVNVSKENLEFGDRNRSHVRSEGICSIADLSGHHLSNLDIGISVSQSKMNP